MAPKDRGAVPQRSKTAEQRVVAAGLFLVDRYNLARLITRLLSRETYLKPDRALPLSWFENVWGYFEVNPVATIPMNRTVICTAIFLKRPFLVRK